MKKITIILGLLFLSMTILSSCGDKDKDDKKSKKDREISVKNLDKDIDNEEDAVEAMITIKKARIELVEKAIGPPLLMMDDEDLEDRAEEIEDASDDIMEDYFEKHSEKRNNDMEEEYYEEDDYDDEWSYEFEESFMEECTSEDYLAVYDYCECALEEIMYEYTPNELENLDPDEVLEFIVENTDCLELIDYDEYE